MNFQLRNHSSIGNDCEQKSNWWNKLDKCPHTWCGGFAPPPYCQLLFLLLYKCHGAGTVQRNTLSWGWQVLSQVFLKRKYRRADRRRQNPNYKFNPSHQVLVFGGEQEMMLYPWVLWGIFAWRFILNMKNKWSREFHLLFFTSPSHLWNCGFCQTEISRVWICLYHCLGYIYSLSPTWLCYELAIF